MRAPQKSHLGCRSNCFQNPRFYIRKGASMRKRTPVTRRKFLTAGGVSALALAGLGGSEAVAADLTATEKANVAVVDAFHKNMSDPAQNLDKVARLGETCSQDIIWGTAGGDKLHGLAAVQEWYTNFFKGVNGGTN